MSSVAIYWLLVQRRQLVLPRTDWRSEDGQRHLTLTQALTGRARGGPRFLRARCRCIRGRCQHHRWEHARGTTRQWTSHRCAASWQGRAASRRPSFNRQHPPLRGQVLTLPLLVPPLVQQGLELRLLSHPPQWASQAYQAFEARAGAAAGDPGRWWHGGGGRARRFGAAGLGRLRLARVEDAAAHLSPSFLRQCFSASTTSSTVCLVRHVTAAQMCASCFAVRLSFELENSIYDFL